MTIVSFTFTETRRCNRAQIIGGNFVAGCETRRQQLLPHRDLGRRSRRCHRRRRYLRHLRRHQDEEESNVVRKR